MALQFDDNLKAMNLTTERSLSTIQEDIEHVNKSLDDISVSRNDHAKIIQELGAHIDKVEARLDARGDASKDPGHELECLDVSVAANSQEPKKSGLSEPADKNKKKHNSKKKTSSESRKGRTKNKSMHPGVDSSSSEYSSSDSVNDPKGPPSSDSEDEVSSESEQPKKGSRANRFPGLKEIRPRNEIFSEALSYKTYRLNNQSQRYDSKVARDLYSYCKKVKPDVSEEFLCGYWCRT